MAKRSVKIGIICGTGINSLDILEDREEKCVDTPYGKPSDALLLGKIKGVECVLLARHGRKHRAMPSCVNYRANVWAMKQEGCTHLLATTACGSLREEMKPGDIIILDQYIDRTTKRDKSFYDGAKASPKGVCHISMALPFCEKTRQMLITGSKELGLSFHGQATVVTIEGPCFSTKAESNLYRSWGADVINMTTVPEVNLAKEAALCYASLALVTDYDCWRENTEDVNVETVMETMKNNSIKARDLLLHVIPRIARADWTDVLQHGEEALKNSLIL